MKTFGFGLLLMAGSSALLYGATTQEPTATAGQTIAKQAIREAYRAEVATRRAADTAHVTPLRHCSRMGPRS